MFSARSGVALTMSAALMLGASAASAQDWQTMSSARSFTNESILKVDVEYGAGQLNIKSGTDASLYRADLRYDADVFRPRMSYTQDRLRVGIEDGKTKGRNMKAGRLDLTLGTRVPLDIDLQFGAAEAAIDLTGLLVKRAVIQTGASQTTLSVNKPNRIVCDELKLEVGAAKFEATGLGNLNISQLSVSGGVGEVILDFSGAAKRDMTAKIEMGLGSLTLRVPRGTGLQVTKNGILSSFDSQGMVKRGDSFYSENWKTAQRHVTIDVSAAFGSVAVVWIDR
jgi:hypothetical protein